MRDGYILQRRDMKIGPGASRRVSFRGTPGGGVDIRAGAKRGPGLPTPEEPPDEPLSISAVGDLFAQPLRLSESDPPSPLLSAGPTRSPEEHAVAEATFVEALLAAAPERAAVSPPGEELPYDAEDAGDAPSDIPTSLAAPRPFFKPAIGRGIFDDVVIVGTEEPPDIDLPQPRPPLGVAVSVRDDVLLKEETLESEFPRLARLDAGPFPGHEIIDVTFTNPNDFPVLVLAFIEVQNEVDVATTVLPNRLLQRVFRQTLLFLAPTFGIRGGKLHFAFPEEAMHTLSLEPATLDIGVDVDVTVNIEPVRFELLSHLDVIETVVRELETEIKAVKSPGTTVVLPAVPGDFVEQTVEGFFSPIMSLPFLFGEQMGLREIQWKKALDKRPILTGPSQLAGDRSDVALSFHLRVTEIIVGASILEVNVDTVTAELRIVLRSAGRPEPYPVAGLPDHVVAAGFIIPRFDMKVDVGDIDVDLELPGGIFTKPFEFVAEAGLEGVADWMKDDLEKEAVKLGMGFLKGSRLAIGELAKSIMREIANRDHVFRRLHTDGSAWTIETTDPTQFALPFVEPDAIDHRFDSIEVSEPDVEPIDGPMPDDATLRLGRIEHLVFLMMENRSFDHMLGYLSHPNHTARTNLDGLDGQAVQLGGDFVGTQAVPQSGARHVFVPDPGHGVRTVAAQIADGAMNGFVSEFALRLDSTDAVNPQGVFNDPERILRFYTAVDLPVFDKLSQTDAILDRWFSSIPGPTYPNRLCYYAGLTPTMSQSEIFDDAGYHTDLTMFDLLDHEGIDWVVYESDVSFLRMFRPYRIDTARIRPVEELALRVEESRALPPVTFIDPNFTGAPGVVPNDDHPPTDIAEGQRFIDQIRSQIQALPGAEATMLVITYDEHGGFYDHVPPPGTSASDFQPDADGNATVPLAHPNAGSYGARVPTLVVSPIVAAGAVGHQIYDHATVYQTIVERFMPGRRNSAILPERVRRARHLGELVTADDGPVVQPVSTVPIAFVRQPDAIVRHEADDFRPHLAAPPDTEDFHHYMTRLGNPFKTR